MNSQTVEVDGIPIRWEEHGDGIPVVLVHGIPTSPALWRYVAPRLVGARALAFEMVGYGQSIPAGAGRDISVSRQADYLIAWLAQLGIGRAIFVGHDLGGGVVQIAAVRHPNVCAGLFLTNAIGYDSWPIPSVKALRAGAAVVRHLPDSAVKFIMATLMARGHTGTKQAREALAIHFEAYAAHGAGAALARQVTSLNVGDTLAVAPELPRLGVPARVTWGAADRFQKIGYGERFSHDLSAPLRSIHGGKHFTPEDFPDIIADEISALLAEVRPLFTP